MKKLLYITDQDEYIDHSFIGPLFETHLKKYLNIDIVYFTEFKSDFERKDEHRFTVPTRYKTSLLDKLNRNEINIDEYEFVIVRNDTSILKHILQQKDKYNYKVGYRLSFPKRRAKLQEDIANNNVGLFDMISSKLKTNSETKIINECDIFLPTSQSMHEEFFDDVTIKTFICSPGINPDILHPNIQHEGNEKRFFYAGTLDSLREFEVVIEAFSLVASDKWKLTISTKDPKYALEMIQKFQGLENNIEIHNATTRAQLLDLIAAADIGVALLPDIPVYNTSTPIKILDYYSSAVPCIMTNTSHSNRIFTDHHDAWFSTFSKTKIAQKVEEIIKLSKDDVAEVGIRGQKRLLDIRNYQTISKNLASSLLAL